MESLIRDFEKFKKYSNLISIGRQLSKKYVYKYMTVDTAVKCLNNNTLRFCIPPLWNDPYESRFYNADYCKVDKSMFNKKLCACCVTENKLSEPAWKMYVNKQEEHSVKFCIHIGQFRTHLNEYARLNKAFLYEGRINYLLDDNEINNLHLKSSQYYDVFFNNFNYNKYLNLLLIKRHLYYYEGEIRYMYTGDFADDYVYIDLPWSMCLSKISINVDDPHDNEIIREALEGNYDLCVNKYSLHYRPYVPIEIENIYKPFKRIVVEK